MFVSSLNVKHFRHLRDISIGPFVEPPSQSEVLAFAGPNGGGKSSLLELIGYALSTPWGYPWSVNRTFGNYSFELAFRTIKEELELIRRSGSHPISAHVMEALESGREIFVGHNYPDGEYAKDASLYNEMFSVVTSILRHQAQRSIGFFLRADRHYPNRGFARESIFNYKNTQQKSYLWSYAFNLSDAQYADMYDHLVQQRWHYMRDLGSYFHKQSRGEAVESQPPADPLVAYDDLLQRLFPGYKFSDLDEDIPTNLFVQLPSGDVIPFNDMSGGEKEVFFVLSFFLRHNVSNSIILIDEPELHLHPELARKLVQQMLRIRPGNQIWVATHNPEVIDETGRDKTFYVARDSSGSTAGVKRASSEGEAEQNLRNLFGYSGYIGVARRMVFLEGQEASVDRKLLSSLFPSAASDIKFIPAGGVDTLYRINSAVLAILEAEFGMVKFYLIRDRDYMTDAIATAYNARAAGKIRVLKRYHIENYLLDDVAISHVLGETYGRTVSATDVQQALSACARTMSAEVLSQMISYRLNLMLKPEDFSQGKFMKGTTLVDGSGGVDSAVGATIEARFLQAASIVEGVVKQVTNPSSVSLLVNECTSLVASAIGNGSWRSLFPGRSLLAAFCKREGIGDPVVLQNSLIKAIGAGIGQNSSELSDIISLIQADEDI